MSRGEAGISAVAVFALAMVAGQWAAGFLTFPRPEDVAYYVGVARNLVEGRGLVTDAIWSYQTPPLVFPRPAFEVWLPLPTFLAAAVMTIAGTAFPAAQLSSTILAGATAVLAWRLGADVAADLALPPGRARVLALGSGLTTAVYLPLVLAAAQPDSTIPFAALALAACLVMGRLLVGRDPARPPGVGSLAGLGLLLGLAALTRNEAIWLAIAWVVVARQLAPTSAGWVRAVGIPAMVALAVFAPWAIRDWITFGSPFPGQALSNALSLTGRDIFAWRDPPSIGRYLDAGLGTLVALRWTGFQHNVFNVLLVLGFPVALIGLVALPTAISRTAVLRPLATFALITFAATTLLFPVSTTWGTFLHSAGAIHVLLIVAALVGLDSLLVVIGRRRGWTRPVAWLGPVLTVGTATLLTLALLPQQAEAARATQLRYAALPGALAEAGAPLPSDGRPVISDFPVWLAEATGHRALGLPDEPPASVLDLAARFGGAPLLVVGADNDGIWPEVVASGAPGAECFTRVPLADPPDHPGVLANIVVFRIGCP